MNIQKSNNNDCNKVMINKYKSTRIYKLNMTNYKKNLMKI